MGGSGYVGELSLGYSQMTCVASLKEHCAQNRFQKLTTTSIVDDGKKKRKGRGRKDDQFIRDKSIVVSTVFSNACTQSAVLAISIQFT